jgi:hypothetical protein
VKATDIDRKLAVARLRVEVERIRRLADQAGERGEQDLCLSLHVLAGELCEIAGRAATGGVRA